MTRGTTKYWTEEQEGKYERALRSCRTFAERMLIMTARDLVKYDQRTREGKRAIAQAMLRIVTATDDDLEELAKLEVQMMGKDGKETLSQALERLKATRQRIRERGISREEITG